MLEPWETLLWMAFLGLLIYFVLSACFLTPGSMCRTTLVAARNSLAAQGAVAVRRDGRGGVRRPACLQTCGVYPASPLPPAAHESQNIAAGAKLLAYTR